VGQRRPETEKTGWRNLIREITKAKSCGIDAT